ncbi:MAG TPA: MgtC/SapB family protein [archaeon]|nr:MgtC/SapB family protein [archaeon]
MILEFQMEITIKLVIAVLLGALIGWEREKMHRPAGLRTHMLVSLGSALFTILSLSAFPGSDPSRIAANIIVGIGFIGAGTVLQMKERVIGLTTAASLWTTSAIGMATGAGFYIPAIVTTLVAFVILWLREIKRRR